MNPAQAYAWLVHFYIEAYEAGLREGEQEFNDAVILDEDAARERIGNEALNNLIGGKNEQRYPVDRTGKNNSQ